MNQADVFAKLDEIVRTYGGYKQAADALGVKHNLLYDTIKSKRQPGTAVLDALGLKKVVEYVPKRA